MKRNDAIDPIVAQTKENSGEDDSILEELAIPNLRKLKVERKNPISFA